MKNKVRESLSQAFLAALQEEQLPWRAVWHTARPYNLTTGKAYRGVNTLSLSLKALDKGWEDPRWCTYRQAQEHGWQVRQGEKASSVEYWLAYDKEGKKHYSIQEARRLVRDGKLQWEQLVLHCRCSYVFNAAQIDGIPPLSQRPATDIGAIRRQRDTLLANMGLGYQEGGSSAYYAPESDTVVLPPEARFEDTYGYMCTFLHECGHATGHSSRLNRDLTGRYGTPEYAREELRAEIASAFVAQELRLELDDQQLAEHLELHKAYIQSWSQLLQKSPDELWTAIQDAQRISDYLIEQGDFAPLLEEKVSSAPEEGAWLVGTDRQLMVQRSSDGGWDYTLYDSQRTVLDGGRIDLPEYELEQVKEELLAGHGLAGQELTPCDVPVGRIDYLDAQGNPAYGMEMGNAAQLEAELHSCSEDGVPISAVLYTDARGVRGHISGLADVNPTMRIDTEPLLQRNVPQPRDEAVQENYKDMVERILGMDPRNAVHVCNTTPLMAQLGLTPGLPVCTTQAHIRSMAAPEGTSGGHGLTAQQIQRIPEILAQPALVSGTLTGEHNELLFFDSSTDDQGRPLVVVVRPEGSAVLNGKRTASHFVVSCYGREACDVFLSRAIRAGKIYYLDKEKSPSLAAQVGVQFPHGIPSAGLVTIIRQSEPNVNSEVGMGKKKFTEEQYQIARSYSALQCARERGYELVQEGGYWRDKEHDSMIFTSTGHWFWNSRGINGRAIEFLRYREGMTLPEAVLTLAGSEPVQTLRPAVQEAKKEQKEQVVFHLPARASEGRHLWAYLIMERGVDREIVSDCVRQRILYQSTYSPPHKPELKLHNAVFVGYDQQGVPRAASLRGCAAKSSYKGEVPGSDKSCPFVLRGQEEATVLRIFEAPIDAMSDATIDKLCGENWRSCWRLATSGNASAAGILRQLQANPQIQDIEFYTDSDNGGAEIYKHLRSELLAAGIQENRIKRCPIPWGKDTNAWLKRWRQVIRHCSSYPTTDGPQEGKLAGRIHFLDPHDGQVVGTAAFAAKDADELHSEVRRLRREGVAMVVETPAQIRELIEQRERREMDNGRQT